MGIELIAAAALVVTGYEVYEGNQARNEAKDNYAKQADEQRKAQGEQKALNFQQQAMEVRKQVREERVRRAKLMQASEAGGTANSSGEIGATGSMTTQLNDNLGINYGRADAGNRIGGYLQNAADFGTAAQQAVMTAQNADAIAGLSMNIFSAAGGFGSFKKGK